MTHKQFVNQVKKTINDQPIPPIYDPYNWENKEFNCYAYALQACINFSYYDGCYPGFFSRGKSNDYRCTMEETLRYFQEDCEVLGLQALPSTMSELIGANEYKIAIYLNEGNDYHFIRQDSNGRWSEKRGWYKKIDIVKSVFIYKDGYEFIGVFRVSKKEM